MHEKRSKIDFFVNFRKLQKKLIIGKKRYAEILHVGSAVVKNVEKKSNQESEFFLVPQKSRQTVVEATTETSFCRRNNQDTRTALET